VVSMESNVPASELDPSSLMDVVQATITESRRFTVVNRSDIQKVMAEQNFQLSGMTKGRSIQLGQLLGARAVVTGKISRLMGSFNITLQRINVETGVVEITATKTASANGNKIISAVRRAAKDLTYR